ncbi:DUF6262 family protein [Nonomuraea polychroma]|uniref:DUF6262 family protein n=1 Tax=Nonomuraea polychroma TaxID=46176 RepID=UPI003D89F7E7
MSDRRIQALADATRKRTENAEKAVEQALRRARSASGPVTIARIAAEAGVSTDFIYKHQVLRPQVEALRRSRAGATPTASHPADTDAAESTLIRRLTQQLAQTRKEHREQITELRAALEAAHGDLLVLRRRLDDRQ